MAQFNPEHKAVLDEMILGYAHVQSGHMFGFPAYYAGKKLCICLYEGGVGIKLPEASAVKLLDSDQNAKPFQPMGKAPMREWIQIDLEESDEYRKYMPLFLSFRKPGRHNGIKGDGKKPPRLMPAVGWLSASVRGQAHLRIDADMRQ